MKTRARILARIIGVLLGAAVFGVASGARAVDDPDPIPPTGASDLTSVRAKVKAGNFKGAIAGADTRKPKAK